MTSSTRLALLITILFLGCTSAPKPMPGRCGPSSEAVVVSSGPEAEIGTSRAFASTLNLQSMRLGPATGLGDSLSLPHRGYGTSDCFADSEYVGYAAPGTATLRVRCTDVDDSTRVNPIVRLCPATSCGIELLRYSFTVTPPALIDSAYALWIRYAEAVWDSTMPDTSEAAVFDSVAAGLYLLVADRARLAGGWTVTPGDVPYWGHSWGTPARWVRMIQPVEIFSTTADTTVVLRFITTPADAGMPCIEGRPCE